MAREVYPVEHLRTLLAVRKQYGADMVGIMRRVRKSDAFTVGWEWSRDKKRWPRLLFRVLAKGFSESGTYSS